MEEELEGEDGEDIEDGDEGEQMMDGEGDEEDGMIEINEEELR